MSLDPYHCYYVYNAMRLHFTSDYDAMKYKFKTSANPKSFVKRRDKFFFGKVARKFNETKELIDYFVAHMSKGNLWVGDMLSDDETYKTWMKRNQSLGYNFKSDLENISIDISRFDDIIVYKDPYPIIIQRYLEGEVCIETIVILNKLTNFIEECDSKIVDSIAWPDIKRLIYNYDPFLDVDLDVTKQIVLNAFTH
jgi:hypothetical protein